MQKIEVAKPVNSRDEEFQKLMVVAKPKKLSNEEINRLLEQIRNGNAEPIERLVDSFETMIVSIAQQIPAETPLEELIIVGKNELRKLAEQEINSKVRERFLRFGAWCVRQRMVTDNAIRKIK